MQPRILIAEDRASMRNTLRNLFTLYSELAVCGQAIDGQQAIDAAGTKARSCSAGLQDAKWERTLGSIGNQTKIASDAHRDVHYIQDG